MPTIKNKFDHAKEYSVAITSELKKLGWWQPEPLPDSAYEDMGAFGHNTMIFAQWIQFVLLPTIDEIIETQDEFPDESFVGVYATREWDGVPEADNLITLLNEFDALFNAR